MTSCPMTRTLRDAAILLGAAGALPIDLGEADRLTQQLFVAEH